MSYKTNGVSTKSDNVVIQKANNGNEDVGTVNGAFDYSADRSIDDNSSSGSETRTAGLGKDLTIVITSVDDEDIEIREKSPIRRSAEAYSEIDLRESALQNVKEEAENKADKNNGKKNKDDKKKKSKSKKNSKKEKS